MNFDVTLLFLSSDDSFPFLPFFRESHDVVLFYVLRIFNEFFILYGDLRYYFYYYYDYESSLSSISAFLFNNSCFISA